MSFSEILAYAILFTFLRRVGYLKKLNICINFYLKNERS